MLNSLLLCFTSEEPEKGDVFEGNTITDSGSKYVMEKYVTGTSTKTYFYYNTVEEPERIYLDPEGTHTHKPGDFKAATLEEAVGHAKDASANNTDSFGFGINTSCRVSGRIIQNLAVCNLYRCI